MAESYQELEEYEKAEEMYLKIKEILERTAGEKNSDFADVCSDLAVLYEDMEVYEKADILHKKAVEIREEVLGKDHPDTAFSYNYMGIMYARNGENQKALEYFFKAYHICYLSVA